MQLCDLYENDSIFDKFECCLSGDGSRVSTGSYRSDSTSSVCDFVINIEPASNYFVLFDTSNLFRVFGCAPGSTEATTLEASKNPMR